MILLVDTKEYDTSEKLAEYILEKAKEENILMDALWVIYRKFEYEI